MIRECHIFTIVPNILKVVITDKRLVPLQQKQFAQELISDFGLPVTLTGGLEILYQ